MSKVFHPTSISQATVQIKCGSWLGTGFFVGGSLVLTALHNILDCIDNHSNIELQLLDGKKMSVTLLSDDTALDVCLLTTSGKHEHLLDLSEAKVRIGDQWDTFGFPFATDSTGRSFKGKIQELFSNCKYQTN